MTVYEDAMYAIDIALYTRASAWMHLSIRNVPNFIENK